MENFKVTTHKVNGTHDDSIGRITLLNYTSHVGSAGQIGLTVVFASNKLASIGAGQKQPITVGC